MLKLKSLLLFQICLIFCLSTSLADTRGIRKVEFKTPSGETVGLYEESHALVIGVSDYTAGWPDLESVAKDVDLVSASLEGHGFNVVRVLNPTKRELSAAFGDFIDEYGYDPENRLLFYYSGHGYTQELHGRQVGYLVPSDAPNPTEDRKGFSRRSLRMTQVLSWSKQIEAKHALFLFDSCFSGSVLKERALVVPQQIRAVTDKPVRQFISAGSAGQTVPSVSIFRPSFIRGIQGEADLDKDGYVTGTELGLFLQKRVSSYDTGQTPQFGKIKDPLYDEGDFVFVLEKSVQKKGSTIASFAPATSQFLPEDEMWKEVKDSENAEDFEDFLTAFPDSKLAPVAMLKLKRLKRKQTETKTEQKQLTKVVLFRTEINGKWGWHKYGDEKKDGKYSGEVKNGEPNGQGTVTWFDGAKFVGEFKDGNENGQGTETFPSGQKYVGGFRDGKRTGQGTFTWPDGAKFVGEYKDGKRNGQGTLTLSDGRKYVGEYKDDKFHGQATYIWPDGGKAIGEFRNGKPWNTKEYNNKGNLILTFVNGVKIDLAKSHKEDEEQTSKAKTGLVIKDDFNGLIWQKKISENYMTFYGAKSHCEELNFNGYLDWRLPRKGEARSIMLRQNDYQFKFLGSSFSCRFWSTDNADNPLRSDCQWNNSRPVSKDSDFKVVCVRDK